MEIDYPETLTVTAFGQGGVQVSEAVRTDEINEDTGHRVYALTITAEVWIDIQAGVVTMEVDVLPPLAELRLELPPHERERVVLERVRRRSVRDQG